MSVGHREVAIPLARGSLSDLRRWARAWLDDHPTGVDSDDVLLAMTETVTNAVRHGSPPVSVELMDDPPHLRVEVTDGSDVLPRVLRQERDREGGRGLELLEVLTERWGVSRITGSGKTVWCMFQALPGPASPS